MTEIDQDGDVLAAPHVIAYDYRRSLGPVLSRFFTGLRDRRILGARTGEGKVLVPPAEYDPSTAEEISDLVEVSSSGVVQTWCWVERPRPNHPLDRPFAFALIQLDGADTALLHAVDAGARERMSSGMRVTARWSRETVGHIRDLACFVPE